MNDDASSSSSSSGDNDLALDAQSAFISLPPELVLVVAEYLSISQVLKLARVSLQNYELLTTHAYARYVKTSAHPTKPLQWAVQKSLLKTAERALLLGVDVNEHFRPMQKTYTPLLMAIENVDVPMVALLLRYGAHPAAMTVLDTPLISAISCQSQEIVKLLLNHKAQPLSPETDIQLETGQYMSDIANLRSVSGSTPLYTAVQRCNASMVELLLSHNAKRDAACSTGRTPLWVAITNDDLPIIKLLLDPNRAIMANRSDGKDNGLVYAASRVPRWHFGAGETIETLKTILLSLKRTSNGRTWFDVSEHILYDQLDHDMHFMKLLLEAGVDPDVKSVTGATLL